ncbi:kinesin-like protein KIN-UB [Amaranthus tricolor]|uniref:kinesin-like protein KIN-UB n=1 Tax=Amaranthus tricolor TaxID=29722 RepID=UPI00258C63EC|nr:kinesin-like protein KIN-UB [Amaranthus tricolor]
MASKNGVVRGSSFKADKPSSKSSSFKSKPPVRRSASLGGGVVKDGSDVPGRVRVAVRLRPKNAEESVADADYADCVELQPELKRLKLRKNNWDSDTYEFDEVLTELASQKRVYEVVAKPVVESVLAGYNGTVLAYGQTGTGKTHTLGQLGEADASERGIMVRSVEDILADTCLETDSVSVSYIQLYMETIQDLLNPVNDNIPIMEDPRTGEVSLPGATVVEIRDQHTFLELLRLGEAHRFAANTKLNTESSRSHAILMVQVKRSVQGGEPSSSEDDEHSQSVKNCAPPILRKGKLVIVDLAGSERVHKSGSEGHTLEEAKAINLSLTALGKCINALAENSPHVPIRDSKLTRLLRDSFGGTARTSLIVTIGPSPRHRGETTSTILFGQRAMKVENMLKIKEEFDYKSLSKRLEVQLDQLIAEGERRQKAFDDEVKRISTEAQNHISEVERKFASELEKERTKCQMDYLESIKQLEEKWIVNQQNQHKNRFSNGTCDTELSNVPISEEVAEVKQLLQNEIHLRKAAEEEVNNLKIQLSQLTSSEGGGTAEILRLNQVLEDEAFEKKRLQDEITSLQGQLLQLTFEVDQMRRYIDRLESGNGFSRSHSLTSPSRNSQQKDRDNGHKSSFNSLFEQVGLQRILSMLESEDPNIRIHAVKIVANLAAEETNQERIVAAGGLTSLLMLLRNYEDETVRRVAAGAIANLAMNEANQELIVAEGGISLLSTTADDAEDPQTLRMVAGAIANLCGNDKLQVKLRAEGGIRALLGMVRCRHPDVLSQIARGIANFAKCESRGATQGTKTGKSLLLEDGALSWIVQNANNEASPIRRHIELALCHLAQHEVNVKDMIAGGALWELVRISRDCSREDIKSLARKTLTSSPNFQAEMRRLRIDI